MEIVKAKIEDVERISKLYIYLNREMAKLQPLFAKEASQDPKFIQSCIENEKSDILLAKENDELLGLALVQKRETPPYPSIVPHLYTSLMDLVVVPDKRGQGIGTALIQEVKKWAKGSDYIELNVLSNNINAIKLYEELGFKETAKNMKMMF